MGVGEYGFGEVSAKNGRIHKPLFDVRFSQDCRECSDLRNITVDLFTTDVLFSCMTSGELKRWLEKHGCSFVPGKGGHLLVRLGSRKSVLPMHGAKRDLPRSLVEGIKKQLELK